MQEISGQGKAGRIPRGKTKSLSGVERPHAFICFAWPYRPRVTGLAYYLAGVGRLESASQGQ